MGQLLLLRYWVRMLCADMEVRLQAAHSSLGARGRAEEAAEAGGEAEEAEARAAVDGSLLLRLLKVRTAWDGGRGLGLRAVGGALSMQ